MELFRFEPTSPSLTSSIQDGVKINQFVRAEGLDLFNTAEFFRLHLIPGGRDYYYQFLCDSRVSAAIHFSEVEPGVFRSPRRGSFGGLFLGEGLGPDAAEGFISSVENHLRAAGAARLIVVGAPFSYHPEHASGQFSLLLKAGFEIENHDFNHSIAIDERPFEARIDSGNRKRIRKCRREGWTARQLRTEELVDAYAVIVENRMKRNVPITLAWQDLQRMIDLMPDRVRGFGVFAPAIGVGKSKLVAASICIVVNPRVFYVFYWGEIGGVESHSPVAMLAEKIYDTAKNEKFALLDLGISSVKGVPNPGLVRFKRNLGCEESLKLTYSKRLS
jgi:hypothetical protein